MALRGDFATLAMDDSSLARGTDGTFSADDRWTLTSETVDFEAQGVAPQHVLLITGPRDLTNNQKLRFAVDSVAGNAVTLRRINMALRQGQPIAPVGGMSGIHFDVLTFAADIDVASFRLKQLFAIDERIVFRASSWIYEGNEDLYRPLREACVQAVLRDVYEREQRDQTNAGDFARKAALASKRYQQAVDAIRLRWGPTGVSNSPTDIFSTRITR